MRYSKLFGVGYLILGWCSVSEVKQAIWTMYTLLTQVLSCFPTYTEKVVGMEVPMEGSFGVEMTATRGNGKLPPVM